MSAMDQEPEFRSEYSLHSLGQSSSHPITTELVIAGKAVIMEIDTGVAVSIISEDTLHLLGKNLQDIKPVSGTILKTYTGQSIPVLGSLKVSVEVGNQHAVLPLLVVKGSGPSLLSRNWLMELKLDWPQILTVMREHLSLIHISEPTRQAEIS